MSSRVEVAGRPTFLCFAIGASRIVVCIRVLQLPSIIPDRPIPQGRVWGSGVPIVTEKKATNFHLTAVQESFSGVTGGRGQIPCRRVVYASESLKVSSQCCVVRNVNFKEVTHVSDSHDRFDH